MNKFSDNALILRTLESTIQRFNESVTRGPTRLCWPWKGGLSTKGYGVLNVHSRPIPAHRIAWILAGRKLDITLELDHLCRNRACVNPAHLEQVTTKINQDRGNGFSGINARKTHCPRGHPYSDQNTNTVKSKGRTWRVCKTCQRERGKRAWIKVRAALAVTTTDGGST